MTSDGRGLAGGPAIEAPSIGDGGARGDALSAIRAAGLRKEYPGGIVAVDGIDIDVREGEIFGFLGPNGAGKTTTVLMLTTLLRPTAGQGNVAGFALDGDQRAIRRSIGVALQQAGLDAIASGRELLEVQAQLFGIGSAEAKRRARELLSLVGLEEAADRRVKTYSGGMKRRLDLASALVHGPRVLFLDEPTEGLDPASRQSVWHEIGRLNRELGVTVFLTTHYLEEADRLAHRVAIIDRGRIVAEGTPAALKASIGGDVITVAVSTEHIDGARAALARLDGIKDVRPDASGLTLFVEDGSRAVAGVIRVLDTASVPVASIAVSQPSLDEVFLRATGSRLEGADAEGSAAP
ncbi:MAG: ATP-binding cassette domain-containing protein [Chloroflexi bacterium]|nr:ATP-binding cassette domain-containing protein [Chloroflexota bacterium]